MDEIILKKHNGMAVVTSRDIAEKFKKQHNHVLRDIGKLKKDVSNFGQMFQLSSAPDKYGREQKVYLINRDGFSLLAMGFTGKEALQWKLKYIEAFNEMENSIKSVLSEKDCAILAVVNADSDTKRAVALVDFEKVVTQPLRKAIEEQKPFVEFANKVSNSSDLISMGKMAKLLQDENIDIGRNRLFEWLREKKILMSDNVPYQRYIDGMYFKVNETPKETSYGTKLFTTTYVTGKGQLYIAEKLRKEWNIQVV